MPKRTVVKIDIESCLTAIKRNHWKPSNVSEMIGKHKNWFSEVKRDRNLPSPEEAARMCAILQVEPEEILIEQDDIALVRSLIDSQREEQQKNNSASVMDVELSPAKQKAWALIQKMDDATLRKFVSMAEIALEDE